MANHGLLLQADWNRKNDDGMFERVHNWIDDKGNKTDADAGAAPFGGQGNGTVQFCVQLLNDPTPGHSTITVTVICAPKRNVTTTPKKASPFRNPKDKKNGSVASLFSEDAKTPSPFDPKFMATSQYNVFDDGQGKNHSTYELSVVASITSGAVTKQFAYDPDMDVDNGSTDPLFIEST